MANIEAKIVSSSLDQARFEREAWLKTPEGEKYLAREAKKKRITENLLKIAESVNEIQFKGPESKVAWDKFVEENSKDPSNKKCIEYAITWAKVMQYFTDYGLNIINIADDISNDCSRIYGVSCAEHMFAKNILIKYWIHGDVLNYIL